ncbi:hypothetical protein D3C73_702300 [compost metagenome]
MYKTMILLMLLVLLSACGQVKKAEESESFASAQASARPTSSVNPAKSGESTAQTSIADAGSSVSPSSSPSSSLSTSTSSSSNPSSNPNPNPSVSPNSNSSTAGSSPSDATPTASPSLESKAAGNVADKEKTAVNSPQADVTTPAVTKPSEKPAPVVTPTPEVKDQAAAPEQGKLVKDKPTSKAASTSSNELSWSEFFDSEAQDTPSDKFWDLNGKKVEIKGYMGEVLSFEKHWFLLIPEPGAECPFDNGDETYWNKIMMVFMPASDSSRYVSGPLKITGKLDVGIKIDESGYKTMFRLYDAKFEKIKE